MRDQELESFVEREILKAKTVEKRRSEISSRKREEGVSYAAVLRLKQSQEHANGDQSDGVKESVVPVPVGSDEEGRLTQGQEIGHHQSETDLNDSIKLNTAVDVYGRSLPSKEECEVKQQPFRQASGDHDDTNHRTANGADSLKRKLETKIGELESAKALHATLARLTTEAAALEAAAAQKRATASALLSDPAFVPAEEMDALAVEVELLAMELEEERNGVQCVGCRSPLDGGAVCCARCEMPLCVECAVGAVRCPWCRVDMRESAPKRSRWLEKFIKKG